MSDDKLGWETIVLCIFAILLLIAVVSLKDYLL